MDTLENQNDVALAETLEETVPVDMPAEVGEPEKTTEAPLGPDDDQALRFRNLRAAREQIEKERDVLQARLSKIEAAQQPVQPQPPEDFSIAPDDLVEGKHLAQYDRHIKKLQQDLESYKQQTTAATVETRLQAQFPDFDSVVSKENIEMLRSAYPEIASTLNSSTDLYSKAVSAYTMIKKLGILPDASLDKQKALVQANAAKPRPIASVGAQAGAEGPLSHANAFAEGLTKKVKADLYREMMEAKKNL